MMNIVRRIAIQTGGGDAPGLTDDERAWVGKSKTFNESEMARISECSLKCTQDELDTADIARNA